MTKLYLVGHGFSAVVRNTAVAPFTLPPQVGVTFYVAPDELFDSNWEEHVVSGAPMPARVQRDADQEGLFRPQRIAPGAPCPEHILTRPGNMSLYKKFSEIRELVIAQDGTLSLAVPLADGDTLAIKDKDPARPAHTRLSAIVALLAAQNLPAPLELHWCACRSNLHEQPGNMADILEQARDAIKPQTRSYASY